MNGDSERRWDRLAADIEAQAEAWRTAQRAGEVAERERAEAGRTRFVDRLRGARGARVALSCHGGLRLQGELTECVSDALVVAEAGGREALVSLPMVIWIGGLGGAPTDPDADGAVTARIGLRHLARGVVRDRSIVRLHLVDGDVLDGTLDRVGADHVEIAVHPAGEPRRRGAVRQRAVVPLTAVVALRRDAR
jgi:hypothetical protein